MAAGFSSDNNKRKEKKTIVQWESDGSNPD